MSDEGKQLIKDFGGAEGWWHEENCTVFIDLGEKLIAKGFREDEAISILQTAFNMTADEFGN